MANQTFYAVLTNGETTENGLVYLCYDSTNSEMDFQDADGKQKVTITTNRASAVGSTAESEVISDVEQYGFTNFAIAVFDENEFVGTRPPIRN